MRFIDMTFLDISPLHAEKLTDYVLQIGYFQVRII